MVDFFNTFLLNGEWKRCHRKVPRANLQSTPLGVALSYPGISELKFRAKTIAEFGACYRTGTVDVSRLVGHELKTAVWIGVVRFDVRSRLLRVQDGWASVEFLEPSEAFRAAVREQFQLELKAASLVPYISFASVEPGPTHALIYSDGEDHELVLSMAQDRLESIRGQLGKIALRFSWSRRRPGQIEFESLDGRFSSRQETRGRVESFLRNLQDLHPGALEAIARAN